MTHTHIKKCTDLAVHCILKAARLSVTLSRCNENSISWPFPLSTSQSTIWFRPLYIHKYIYICIYIRVFLTYRWSIDDLSMTYRMYDLSSIYILSFEEHKWAFYGSHMNTIDTNWNYMTKSTDTHAQIIVLSCLVVVYKQNTWFPKFWNMKLPLSLDRLDKIKKSISRCHPI